MNVIDLFCGAGGLSYGFESAGFDILLGIDNDAAALKTFEKNHKNIIPEFRYRGNRNLELLTFGFVFWG